MLITGLRKLKKGSRIGVYLDGEYGFSVELNTLVREGLANRQYLTQEEVDRIRLADRVEYLYLRVLALLSRRARSEFEMRRYLREKLRKLEWDGSTDSVVESVLEKLRQQGYSDDLDFARQYRDSLLAKARYSTAELRKKLASRGISRDIVEQVLDEGGDDQKQVVKDLIARHSSRIRSKSTTDKEYRQKMMQYLRRKGFGWDAISSAL
ncbi:MAG: Regulatory protein RecX [candidate division WS6 bacterium OLB20]|uniref:Regulatory protein RecX n=1 Tax=candidate division WS6 bacterium OLB20 TaxID=1617426 RepID=A0A136LWH6_9BACT|nr:MAG: Regulatory protein RecX [candidate division WS6 bacterium OLB20]